jgi:hypothetical protein
MKKFIMMLLLLPGQIWANEQASDTLDKFHQAAAEADFNSYFSVFAEKGVFMGTDGSERWTKNQFKDYVKVYFDQGKGWLYQPNSRHFITTNNDDILVFDELLENSNYGQCRGSGVLIKNKLGWQILQYNLSITVPNGVATEVVSHISQFIKSNTSQ